MAALRGHRVVLLEKCAELGGQVLLAARAPARAEYVGIVRFLIAQVRKLDVEIRLGVEATPALVLAEQPDAVVVASGSHAYIPPVPGSDGKHVVTDRDVLAGEATVGANVVVVDDVHTEQALSTAELLLEQGKRVEVISPLFHVGQDVGVTSIAPLYRAALHQGCRPHPEHRAPRHRGLGGDRPECVLERRTPDRGRRYGGAGDGKPLHRRALSGPQGPGSRALCRRRLRGAAWRPPGDSRRYPARAI